MTDAMVKLRIAVIGPGAIGGTVAAALLEAGYGPTLCVRSGGFSRPRVEHPEGEVDRPVHVIEDPSALGGPVEIAFLAVKAHQTEGCQGWLDACVGPGTRFVALQNGVEHRARVEPLVHEEAKVVPAIVNLPADRSAPNHIVVGGRARLTLEAQPGATEVAALFDDSFVQVRTAEDWVTPAWVKLMMNAASGGICTLAQSDDLALRDPEAKELALVLMHEVAEVGRPEGAALDGDLPERIVEGSLSPRRAIDRRLWWTAPRVDQRSGMRGKPSSAASLGVTAFRRRGTTC